MDLDDLLPVLGEFGRYQKLLLWLICLPACIPCGFCAFNQLFMTDAPDDYWCSVPNLNAFNFTEEQIRDLAIPSSEVGSIECICRYFFGSFSLGNDGFSRFQVDGVREYSKCSRYVIDWQRLLNTTEFEAGAIGNVTWPTEYCYDGWVYNKSHVTSSIVIDVSTSYIRVILSRESKIFENLHKIMFSISLI